jgi:hypothetical protein
MEIPDVPILYPPKIERNKTPPNKNINLVHNVRSILGNVYKNMIDEMQQMPFIKVV